MTRGTKILIVLCSLMAALFHFSLITVYAFRTKTVEGPSRLQQWYADPFFHQDWKLFVPPPAANYRLFVMDSSGTYKDLLLELRLQHQQNRLAGKGHLLLSFVNYIYMFEKNTSSKGGKIEHDPYFDLLTTATQHYQHNHYPSVKNRNKIFLLVEEKQNRLYFN